MLAEDHGNVHQHRHNTSAHQSLTHIARWLSNNYPVHGAGHRSHQGGLNTTQCVLGRQDLSDTPRAMNYSAAKLLVT